MNKRLLLASIIVLIVFGGTVYLLERASKNTAVPSDTIPVTASFYPVYFFVKEIGGTFVTVTNVTPPGTEPHDYDPTTRDIAKMSTSRVLVLNGVVEIWADKIEKILKDSSVHIVTAGEGLFSEQRNVAGEIASDPHIWLDPVLASVEVRRIADALVLADPAHVGAYRANEENLLARLETLDQDYVVGLGECASRDIVTSHSAFEYLALRYGLQQVSIAGLSPDQEPSAKDLSTVSDFAKANNVQYIFFESLVSPKLADTLAKEIGAKTLVLNPLEGITDAEAVAGRDYFSVMRDNLTNLQIALQCKM